MPFLSCSSHHIRKAGPSESNIKLRTALILDFPHTTDGGTGGLCGERGEFLSTF